MIETKRIPVDTPEQYVEWYSTLNQQRDTTQIVDNVLKSRCDYEILTAAHDAWRSTKIDSSDEFAHTEYTDMPYPQNYTSMATGLSAVCSIHRYATYEWPERSFDNGIVYDAMSQAYKWYTAYLGVDDDDLLELSAAETNSMKEKSYALKPPKYKEVDRRIVLAVLSTLDIDDMIVWQLVPEKARLLEDTAVRQAMDDGKAILASIRGQEIPYDEASGFAHETSYWKPSFGT